MKHIFHTIQHTARAATVLLLALLAAQTAGAEDAVTYIDMDGKTKTVTEYTEVTTDMNLYWSTGTYVVKSSVTLNGCISFDYPAVIDLIVCDGATLTVNGNDDGAFDGTTLNIYAQSNGTGMGVVNVKKVTSCSQLNIAGGKVTLDDDGAGYGLYVYSGDACGLTVNGGDVTIQNSNGSQGAIYFNGPGFVILNGGKLTVTNSMENGYAAIEGRGSNTINFNGGTAVINGKISNFKNINLNSGNVTVNGEIDNSYGYTVTYDFTRATDSYYIKAFSNDLSSSATRTVQVKDGATFLCDGNIYIGPLTLTDDDISAISAQTMTPDVSNHFSVNDAGTEYTIHTAKGWDLFCDMLEAGETFSGKTVELDGDITVTRMAGGQPFTGTFNGDGHTLTLAYGTADAPVDAQFVAPFVEVAGAAKFTDLTIAGSIHNGYATSGDKGTGGLIGCLRGGVTVEHCVSTVTVNAASDRAGGFVGLCEHAVTFTDCVSSATVTCTGSGSGFVGWSRDSKYTIAFYGCLFSGKVLKQGTVGSGNGSFVGWKGFSKTVTITNCIAAPAADENMATDNSATFCRYSADTTKDNGETHIANGYYTHTLGAAQGKQAHTVTAGTDVTVAHAGVVTHYATSGITAYKATGASADSDPFIAGLLYNNNVVDVLYAGSDDVVSLTLSNTATGAPAGYQYAGYTTNAGTLDGSTLTMPDEDVTVSLALTVLPWDGDGSKGNPYIIYNKDQLDLLAHRVNGTHDETANDYYNTYFKLAKDISYPHTSDWDAFDSDESNYEAIGGYYDGTDRYFRGHFDGNNNTISGIRIYKDGNDDADRFQGIFGLTVSGADIHDLTLADARITGYNYTGGIVGYNDGGTVSGCHVASDVAVCAVQPNAYDHGGIVGNNGGTIEQCTSAATLTTAYANSAQFYGGIAGDNYGGTLHDNLAIGATLPATKGNTYGAITGYNDGSLQRNYYAACNVADTENATGVGCGNIDDGNGGYTTADVTANNGAVSIHTLTLADGITTTTAATVTIGTTGYYAQGTAIALSYSGTIGEGYQLGIVRNDGNGFTAAVADGDGHYTAVMPAANATATDHAPIDWATVSTGADKDNAYMIYNKDQLDLLAHRVNGTHGETRQTDGYENKFFQLAKDISYPHKADGEEGAATESNYEAIGGYYDDDDRYFCGHFDGNNKTISGIRIYKDGDGDAYCFQGIFGLTVSGADIHDLTLADARITGCQFTGGIVGYNDGGTVSGCHVAADVAVCAVQSYAWYHGGIVGLNRGAIEQCTSAATLTIANADNSQYYGGIAGFNNKGTLSDNLAIGAIVPAAAKNSYGAITGYTGGTGGTLQRNYYTACNVNDTPNATGVGCGYISDGNGGYTTADVTANNGAVSIHALTLADGITTTTAATVTIGTTGYYAQGTAIALSYSGDVPLGYQYDGFTASAGTLEGSTLTMPDKDVTVSVLRSTGEAVEVSYVDADGTAQKHDAIALDGTEPDLGSNGKETWYFVGTDIAFGHMLNLSGDVHLILADGCTMNVTSSNDFGIDVDGSLTIYGQTDGTGALNATGFFVGIFTDSGTITISGGRVTATSGTGYGIHSDHGNLTISGGRVTATGGTGISTNSGTITISGGRVTATGSYGITTNSGTITLGCTNASDFIYASSYLVGPEGSLKIADGQTLFDEYGNYYSGTLNDYDFLGGKTLRLYGLTLAAREAPDGNYWTTYYNGAQGFTIDDDENACAYTATYGGDKLTLNKLGKEIPAGTAVIIVADNDEVSMTATTDLDAYTDANDLHGVDVDTPVANIRSDLGTGTFYVLGMTTVGNEQHFGFHRYTGEEMAAHKAFVLVSGSQARSLTMVFDEASGIESLTPDAAPKAQAADHWFTLDGRRLQAKPTAPGIYINNGKKVVIK